MSKNFFVWKSFPFFKSTKISYVKWGMKSKMLNFSCKMDIGHYFLHAPFCTQSRPLNLRYSEVSALNFCFECTCLMIAIFKGRSPVTKRSVIKEAWQIGMRDGICFKVLHTRTFIFFFSSSSSFFSNLTHLLE